MNRLKFATDWHWLGGGCSDVSDHKQLFTLVVDQK